jgi:hypothetical protein
MALWTIVPPAGVERSDEKIQDYKWEEDMDPFRLFVEHGMDVNMKIDGHTLYEHAESLHLPHLQKELLREGAIGPGRSEEGIRLRKLARLISTDGQLQRYASQNECVEVLYNQITKLLNITNASLADIQSIGSTKSKELVLKQFIIFFQNEKNIDDEQLKLVLKILCMVCKAKEKSVILQTLDDSDTQYMCSLFRSKSWFG